MKILHTADLHLRSDSGVRWEALLAVIKIGKKEKVDALVIAGDLFDRGIDAERLRTAVRPVFDDTGFPVLILPGNHDQEAYGEGKFFGNDVTVLTDPDRPLDLGPVGFWGLPFVPGDRERVLARLHELARRLDRERVNILVYHGELIDTFFSRTEFGEEGADRYMPCRLSWFGDLGFSYVLGGHFHSNFDIRTYTDNAYFVYPGSPVSITRKEASRRKVNLFEVGKPPVEYLLDTAHYERVAVTCDPFSEKIPLDLVKEGLSGLDRAATALLSVTGFIDGTRLGTNETNLLKEIKKIAKSELSIEDYSVRDVSSILGDDLFVTFTERLAVVEPDGEKRARITRMVIDAMMEAAV